MKKIYMTILALMIMANATMAQTRFDSASMEPSYLERGDDVSIYVKFHQGLNKREIYVTPTKNGEKMPIGGPSSDYYIARITPKDKATEKYIIIKQGERNVGSLSAGESWTSPFEVHITDDAPATNYTLNFEILKTNPEKTKTLETILSQDIILQVSGTPKFNINSDNNLNAGETKEFRLSISNVGGGTARQVTVSLNATSPITVLRSSSKYLGDMTGKTFKDLIYDLQVDSSAEPKAYTIPIEIKYIDRSGTVNTVTDTLGVKVSAEPRVSASIDAVSEMSAGNEGTVTLSVVNKGFVDAKFLSIEVLDTDNYTVTSTNKIYIGNLASDDFETEDYTIDVAEEAQGKIPLKVRVTYTEKNNNIGKTIESDLNIHVLSAEEYKKAHPNGDATQQIIAAVMILPAIIVGYIVLWLMFKVIGAVTSLIDRKIFKRH